jgi:hypothetical protein
MLAKSGLNTAIETCGALTSYLPYSPSDLTAVRYQTRVDPAAHRQGTRAATAILKRLVQLKSDNPVRVPDPGI